MTRYDFAPLERLVLAQVGPRLTPDGQQAGKNRLLAEALGTSPRQVYRWRQIGVTADQADELAVRVGFHPVNVWPEVARAHKAAHAAYQRRWRRTRRGSASHRRSKARWRAAVGGYQTVAQRQWRAENRERKREQDRRYWERHGAERNAARRDRYHSDPEYRERKLAAQRERDRAKARTKNKDTPQADGVVKKTKHPVMENVDYKEYLHKGVVNPQVNGYLDPADTQGSPEELSHPRETLVA